MCNHLKEKIQQQAGAISKDTVAIRRHLHQHPELSFQEVATAKFLAGQLRKLPLDGLQTGVGGNGLVATIKGKKPTKRTVALRADIDALPIVEENDVPYKSQNEGVMHACGHDVHAASLWSVAHILSSLKGEFEGTVRLIFQPAEETLPGGALGMIEAGVLDQPIPDSILGQHVSSHIPVGKVGFVEPIMLASGDEIHITVEGKGGHAASPHKAVDPIIIASHLVIALQQLVSRNSAPLTPSVLSLCKIAGGATTNVIPESVQIKGTFRTVDEEWRSEAHQKMIQLGKGLATAMGGKCIFEIKKGYPCLENDVSLTRSLKAAAEELLGKENVVTPDLSMGTEDFAYYAQKVPACFYWLGVRNEAKNITHGVHTARFDVDESVLTIAPALMSWLTLKALTQ